METLIDLIITIFSYMIIPLIWFSINKYKYSNKYITLFNFFNSLFIMSIFIFIRTLFNLNDPINAGAPAILYWCVNNILYINILKWNYDEEKNNINMKKKSNKNIIKRKRVCMTKKILYLIPVFLLLLCNIFFISQYFILKSDKSDLEDEINELKSNIDELEIAANTVQNCIEAKSFLDTYVAIIPVGQTSYLNYTRWSNSRYSNQSFSIMGMQDAINKGYSNKYMQSPIPLDVYKELYGNSYRIPNKR